MKRFCILLLWWTVIAGTALAQPPHVFTQYTSEHGLFQKYVQSILQDHKGLMWFATWDGLYKFDGYTFTNYKAHPGDGTSLNNNRMDYIKEDPYGYIWLQSYDHRIFRFNPGNEKFNAIPYENYLSQEYYVLASGDVWVTTVQNELIHVTTHPDTHELAAENFFNKHQIPYLEKVYNVYLDSLQQQWILTENGLFRLEGEMPNERLFSYFVAPPGKEKQPFYDVLEDGDALYFASDKGCIWICRGEQFALKKLPTFSSVKAIKRLTEGKLLVATANDGFFVYNTGKDAFSHYNTANCKALCDDQIREVYVDSHQEVWMSHHRTGVTHFNPRTGKMDYFILQDKYGKDIVDSRPEMYIHEDINGSLWIHPAGGGFAWYDRSANEIRPFYNPALQSGWSSDNKVTGIFTDKQGNLWLCSYGNGLEKVTFNIGRFHLLKVDSEDSEFPGNNTRAVFQDRDGNIWTGGKDKRIRIYDKQMRLVGILTAQGHVERQSKDELGIAYAFTQDHTGTVWIGTKGNGLIAAIPQSKPYGFRLQTYTTDTDNIYSISGNSVYSLHEDSLHRLWIATYEGGINYLDLAERRETAKEGGENRHFINYRNRLKNYPIGQCYRTRFVTSDPDGNVWIGSTVGLLMCEGGSREPEQIRFRHFKRIPSDAGSLSNNDVHSVFFTRKGEMYVATFGGGFCKLLSLDGEEARFQSYTMKEGLASDILLSIEEDTDGNLWLATEEKLCKFIPSTGNIENYPSKVFPMHCNFNEGAAVRTQEGLLMFNTVKGILYFSPDSISTDKYVPPIIFTHFLQLGKTAAPEEHGILTTNIDESKHIKLPHDRNSFTIRFAALDMRHPNSILYAYQLEGFENEWNYIGNSRTATYTNLPKGNYTLKVKSTNSEGVWVENVRTLQFTVLPSFWETSWAYLLYVLLVTLVISTASYILFTIFRLKHKVAMEQQISDIKLRFFTNISHELRTPLSLIAGPVEQVLQSGNLKDEERELLVLVERNMNRMLHLVNQILDFRKIQNHKMRMRVQQVDLIPFTQHIMENFNGLADEQQIDFKLETALQSLRIWADVDKLEKVLFNLLSNAFKYTPQGKQIRVLVTEQEKEVTVAVEDQGIGISESKQKSLFIRFENFVDKNIFNQASTGIGLSLVKELIEMHHGTIRLHSVPGEGSCFFVNLPKGKEHFGEEAELILSDQVITDTGQLFPTPHPIGHTVPNQEDINKEKQTLLIVEDNRELRFFLRSIFLPYFNVIEAEDGREGVEKSQSYQPDIIVSDVMMPGMDGIEMTRALREEMTTSHIPIILLTAKSNIESKLEGMKLGADDYITKPFSAAYLKARVFNLLEQRKKLQALYCATLLPSPSEASSQDKQEEATPVLSPNEQKFMNQVLDTIERNLDNGNLTVEDIAQEVHMSRSVFFKKLKSLTGLSPVEFLKEVRMKRAVQLIETEEYSMAQIAYMVGINDSHYFSKCFKQQYGITPTEYKDSRKRSARQ